MPINCLWIWKIRLYNPSKGVATSPRALLKDLQRGPWENTKLGTLEIFTKIIKTQQHPKGGSGPTWLPSVFPGPPQSLLKALHPARDLCREGIMSSVLESQNFRARTKLCFESYHFTGERSGAHRGRCCQGQTLPSGAPSTLPCHLVAALLIWNPRLQKPGAVPGCCHLYSQPWGRRNHFLFSKPVLHSLFVPILTGTPCLLFCLFVFLFRVSRKWCKSWVTDSGDKGTSLWLDKWMKANAYIALTLC